MCSIVAAVAEEKKVAEEKVAEDLLLKDGEVEVEKRKVPVLVEKQIGEQIDCDSFVPVTVNGLPPDDGVQTDEVPAASAPTDEAQRVYPSTENVDSEEHSNSTSNTLAKETFVCAMELKEK